MCVVLPLSRPFISKRFHLLQTTAERYPPEGRRRCSPAQPQRPQGKATVRQPLTVSTFRPATGTSENRHSPRHADGKMSQQRRNTLGQAFSRNYSDNFQRSSPVLTLAVSHFSDRTRGRAGVNVVTLLNSGPCLNLGSPGRYCCRDVPPPAGSLLSAKHFALKCEKKEMYSWIHRQHRYNTNSMTSEASSKHNMQSDKSSRLWWALGTPQKTLLQKRQLQNSIGILGR